MFVFGQFDVIQCITLILYASFQIRFSASALAFCRVTEKSAKLQKIFEHQISFSLYVYNIRRQNFLILVVFFLQFDIFGTVTKKQA